MSSRDPRVYVGNLPPDVRTKDIEYLFDKYGPIRDIELKNRKGPPFAFVEYKDYRDAEDAVSSRDGYNFDGYTLRVETPRGGRGGGGGSHFSYGGRGGGYSRGSFGRGGRGSGPSRRSEYKVLVSGLPSSGSWQDLKDHMREAGDVCFADTYKDGTGLVEYLRRDDMNYAVKELDDSKFRSHEGEVSYIRVKPDYDRYSRSRSRSYSPVRSRRRSSDYSPVHSRHRSRSR